MLRTLTPHAAVELCAAPFLQTLRRPQRLLPVVLTALLVACGGGGDSGGAAPATVAGPPATAAALNTTSPNEAAQAAQSVVASADAAVARSASLTGFSAAFGSAAGAQASPAMARKQALAVVASPCDEWVDLPCTGSATFDTNVVTPATVLNPGDYLDVRFASVSGMLLGKSVLLNGRMRMDFLSTINLNATQFPGLNLLLTLDGFGGAVNGRSFGPITDLCQLQISSQGVGSLTAAGARYTGLNGVSTSGPGDYVVAGTGVRKGYWADTSQYVDLSLSNWRVATARPAVGSTASVSGAQGSISVVVTASSPGSVVYAVDITGATGTTRYGVTATYPPSGGAPVYTAVPA